MYFLIWLKILDELTDHFQRILLTHNYSKLRLNSSSRFVTNVIGLPFNKFIYKHFQYFRKKKEMFINDDSSLERLHSLEHYFRISHCNVIVEVDFIENRWFLYFNDEIKDFTRKMLLLVQQFFHKQNI